MLNRDDASSETENNKREEQRNVNRNDLRDVCRLNPGPGVRGLLSIASHYGLADIDIVGLRPVASLLD